MSEEIIISEKDLLKLMEQAFDEGNAGYIDTRDSTVYSIFEKWKLKRRPKSPAVNGNGTGSCLPKWDGNHPIIDNTWSTSNIIVNVGSGGSGGNQLQANLSMEAVQDLQAQNIDVTTDIATMLQDRQAMERFYAGHFHDPVNNLGRLLSNSSDDSSQDEDDFGPVWQWGPEEPPVQ